MAVKIDALLGVLSYTSTDKELGDAVITLMLNWIFYSALCFLCLYVISMLLIHVND